MILLFGLLANVILGALVIGQARLTWNAVRSGHAGFGRFAAEKASALFRYYVWLAMYLGFLFYVATLLVGTLLWFAQEFLA